jgi:hypothetical protein
MVGKDDKSCTRIVKDKMMHMQVVEDETTHTQWWRIRWHSRPRWLAGLGFCVGIPTFKSQHHLALGSVVAS